MIDDWLLSLAYAAWLAASTMPLGFMLGSPCSPCCGCGGTKPVTNPENEGTWTPSGTWKAGTTGNGITWAFTANPGDNSGQTWYFFGSAATSKSGGGATLEEQQDWGNLCNWYSSVTDEPAFVASSSALNKRSATLPPDTAVVHIFTPVSTVNLGPATVKVAYFHNTSILLAGSEITTTEAAHGTTFGVVFSGISNNAGGNRGIVNGGALFIAPITGGARTANASTGTVNDGATFLGIADNSGTINGGAVFFDSTFNNRFGTVNGGATFNDFSSNGFAVFPYFASVINGGAVFNDFSVNDADFTAGAAGNNIATVNGGATFNDAACSRRTTGLFPFPPLPCDRKFVAHPSDLPICNGTARAGCVNISDRCGCG